MIPCLTAIAAKEILAWHGVKIPSKSKRAALDEALTAHVCRDCKPAATQLELVPGKLLQTRARNKALRAKCNSEGQDDGEMMEVDRNSDEPLQFTRYPPKDVPFPPKPLTQDDEIEIVRRACASLDPQVFEEAGCAVCGQLTPKKQLSRLKEVKGLLNILEVDGCAKREIKNNNDTILPWSGPVIDDTCTMPTAEMYKKLAPFLVRRNHVMRALQWLKLNHTDYSDIDISQEHLNTYPEDVPPVVVEYIPKIGNKSAENTAVYDMDDEDGIEEGECPFTVHGITARDIDTVSISKLRARSLHHLNHEGKFLNIGRLGTVSMWNNPQLYPQMFPWLFPYGMGGIGSINGLSNRMHKRRLLMYHDKRFQKDTTFSFVAFSHEQMASATISGRLLADRAHFNEITHRLLSLNPKVLQSLTTRIANGEIVRAETEMEKQCWRVVQDLDCVMSKVDGSITTKKNMRAEVWSLVARFGSPSWYFTMAPVDTMHPLSIYFASDNTTFTPNIGEVKDRVLKICKNPTAAARFFHYMVTVFIRDVLGFEESGKGIFGDVSAYYGTVEQQGRLTLHVHMIIWIKGNISPQDMRDRIMSDSVWQKAVVEWLESCHVGEFLTGSQADVKVRADNIEADSEYSEVEKMPVPPPSGICANNGDYHVSSDSACNDDDNMDGQVENVKQLESNCDCKYCKAKKTWWDYFLYRFDTVFLRSNVHSCERLLKIDGTSSKKMLYRSCRDNKYKRCRARFPRPLHAETKVDPNTGALIMKKGEPWVNMVNRIATFIFGCNTDATSLMSGTAMKAIIVYVTDYITKPGLKTHVLFDAIATIINKSTEILVGDMKAKEKGRRLMTKIVNLISAKMELGAPMIALYLLGNPDHYTSHEFKALYWKQYMLEVKRAFPDEVEIDDTDKLMLIKQDGKFVGLSMVSDYIYRSRQLEELCPYEFVQRCTRIPIPKKGNGSLPKSAYPFMNEHPLSATHVLKVNVDDVEHVIPNFIGPPLPRPDTGDPVHYAATMLSLFVPWRKGNDLRKNKATWFEAFSSHKFPAHYVKIMANINLKYECLDARDDYRYQMRMNPEAHLGKSFPEADFEPIEEDFLAPEWSVAEQGLDLEAQETGSMSRWELDRLKQVQDMQAVLHDLGWDQSDLLSTPVARFEAETKLPNMPQSHWRGLVQNKRLDIITERSHNVPSVSENSNRREQQKTLNNGNVFIADKSYLTKSFIVDDSKQVMFMEESMKLFKLNYEQEKAFRIVANRAIDPFSETLHMYIGGMGGTGKSQVLKALKHFFNLRRESHRLIVVAPTGSAAALLGGMTYHSAFGINDKTNKANMSAISERLTGVDYVFFDEVSMLSCRDLYRISARLCRVLNMPEESFGGLSMILVGDFAQLPPAVGGEPTSLYGHLKYAPGNANRQKEVIGQSIWHEFTTVVMLKENMRQVKKGDDGFRTMLENMRYKDCTWEDIKFLRSRISSNVPGMPSICDTNFRNVSVITTKNLLKDTMNEIGSIRFAKETRQKLSDFFSEDVVAVESDKTDRNRIKGKISTFFINKQMQLDLWHQLPSTTKKHVPGKLSLCVGMPVLIRTNSATELGITNGQEAHVYGWQEAKGSKGQPVIDTLFVKLDKPPAPVKLNGLPENVVPIIPSTVNQLECSIRGGLKVLIDRTQVEILPNFAMTDFASQGKTREYNVVDLQGCSTHQSMYTALSRGTCATGTIIMRDFSPKVIMNGISGRQRQEFRELALLDEITDQRYNKSLSVDVFGTHRKELIASYRKMKGEAYMPKTMHRALRWSADRPWMENDTPHLEWQMLEEMTVKKVTKTNNATSATDVFIPALGSRPLKRKSSTHKDEVVPKKKPRMF
ncbi:hypothetical protein NMY22_g12441 [Coprinellus aureogranulatus]|nr:hypothetical protein NMY22_g12441 [Coprinellus aureogranulatus]